MKGTIKNVHKWGQPYFFIDGEDGNTYFAHKADLVGVGGHTTSFSYKCVWNGNTIEFDVQPTEENHDRAVNLRPAPIKDPYEKERKERHLREQEEARIRREEEAERHRINREKNEELHRRKVRREEYIKDHTRYCVYRDQALMKVFKDKEHAQEFRRFLKDNYPESRCNVRKCLYYIIDGKVYYRYAKR